MSKPKAYSYLRFSSSEQEKGGSLDRQKSMAQEYASKHGLELDTELTFRDLGVSALHGRNIKVGKLGEFIDAVHTGIIPQGSYLLVESLDRISRDQIVEAQSAFLLLITSGITLVTLADNRSYSRESINLNPSDIIVSIALLMRAHDESAMKSRRHKYNWKQKREQAATKPMTAICPAWLRLKEDRSAFEVQEDRAAVVRRIYGMALAGDTPYRIAEYLNKESIPHFTTPWSRRQSNTWHKSYVVKILANPAVVGTHTPHRVDHVDDKRRRVALEPIPGYYPAVVSEDDFHRAQSMREAKGSPLRGRHAGKKVANIFASLARCPLCGASMPLCKKNPDIQYFVCGAARNGSGCSHRGVRYDMVEAAFLREAGYLIAQCPSGGEAGAGLRQDIKRAEAAEMAISSALENVLTAIESAEGASPAALTIRAGELEAAQRDTRLDLERLREKEAAVTGPLLKQKLSDLDRLTHDVEVLDKAAINAVLRQLLSSVVLDYQTGEVIMRWQHDGETSFMFSWPKEQK